MGLSASRPAPCATLHDRYLEPSEALDYEILVLANKGYLLLLRRLLRRTREHINRARSTRGSTIARSTRKARR